MRLIRGTRRHRVIPRWRLICIHKIFIRPTLSSSSFPASSSFSAPQFSRATKGATRRARPSRSSRRRRRGGSVVGARWPVEAILQPSLSLPSLRPRLGRECWSRKRSPARLGKLPRTSVQIEKVFRKGHFRLCARLRHYTLSRRAHTPPLNFYIARHVLIFSRLAREKRPAGGSMASFHPSSSLLQPL